MKDVFGAEYGVGDTVVYATVQGYSSAAGRLRIGRVVKISGRSVTIQPFRKAGERKPTKYIDTRTGKGIDPFCASRKHIAEEEYVTDRRTGKRLTENQLRPYLPREGFAVASAYNRNPDFVPYEYHEYHKEVFKDYVGTAEVKPRVSVLAVSDIALWTGPVPDGWEIL